jgi:hypothetical protein
MVDFLATSGMGFAIAICTLGAIIAIIIITIGAIKR